MEKVTGEQVKAAMIAADIARVDHHECGGCGWMVYYFRDGEDLFFDPSCDCSSGSGQREATWDDAAEWINMQTNEVSRNRIAGAFGLRPNARGNRRNPRSGFASG